MDSRCYVHTVAHMEACELVTTTELALSRGVTRQAILLAVKRGTLVPAHTMANGHHLFEPDPDK